MGSFLSGIMQTLSGGASEYRSAQLLFDKVVGVRGIVPGVGATTIVYNLAAAIADTTSYRVCVLDTHILYPTLRGLLVAKALPSKDWFDFSSAVSDIVCETKFHNVNYIGFYGRALSDMLSAKECRAVLDNLLPVLKELFDIILVDLSDEITNVAVNAAVKCNKIYTVVSPEPACMFGFKTSINTAVTTAVSAYKLKNVIFNKSVGPLDATMLDVLKKHKFNVLASIPYSTELLRYNLVGNAFWAAPSRNTDITAANTAIAVILKDLLEETSLNKKYINADGQHNLVNEAPAPDADGSAVRKAMEMQEKRTETTHGEAAEHGIVSSGNPARRRPMKLPAKR